MFMNFELRAGTGTERGGFYVSFFYIFADYKLYFYEKIF